MKNDLISRQAAIDAVDRERKKKHLFNTAEDGLLEARRVINTLPSAQPEKVLVAEVKLSKDQIQTAVDNIVEKMMPELDPCDFCKHKDDCGYMSMYCPAERKEE